MWQVGFSRKSAKQLKKLQPEMQAVVALLVEDLRLRGPMLPAWRNFGKLRSQGAKFHCHLRTGRPTFVACWEVIDQRIQILEIYYVGTHEGAPY